MAGIPKEKIAELPRDENFGEVRPFCLLRSEKGIEMAISKAKKQRLKIVAQNLPLTLTHS